VKGKVVNLFDHVHNFTVDAVVDGFTNERNNVDNVTDASFDSYKEDEIMLSRLVVESLISTTFCLLVMALETCNATASHDIDAAASTLLEITLDDYPGENIADMMIEALRLIRIMKAGFWIPIVTGSRLLCKVFKTSCKEFNRKIFNLLDNVKSMEHALV
jgi:hypothetical protein